MQICCATSVPDVEIKMRVECTSNVSLKMRIPLRNMNSELECTSSVSLKMRIGLKMRMATGATRIPSVASRAVTLLGRIAGIEAEIVGFKADLAGSGAEIVGLKADLAAAPTFLRAPPGVGLKVRIPLGSMATVATGMPSVASRAMTAQERWGRRCAQERWGRRCAQFVP